MSFDKGERKSAPGPTAFARTREAGEGRGMGLLGGAKDSALTDGYCVGLQEEAFTAERGAPEKMSDRRCSTWDEQEMTA